MSIHSGDPFATPAGAKSAVRRLRGRLPAAVTLWTGYGRDQRPAGLTVSSTLVVDGQPGRLLATLDEESTVWEAISATGQFAMMPLRAGDAQLADAFAGLMPAPGGPFTLREWQSTSYGPVLAEAPVWAGCRLDGSRPFGWSLLVEATIVDVVVAADAAPPPLIHYRGRYRTAPDADR